MSDSNSAANELIGVLSLKNPAELIVWASRVQENGKYSLASAHGLFEDICMKFSLRSLIWVPLTFSIGFALSASLIVIQARDDIREELESATHVAKSLALLIEYDRIGAQEAKNLQFRHIRISTQPPHLVNQSLNVSMPSWLANWTLGDVGSDWQKYSIHLDPVQMWTVYATPEDELDEVWESLTSTFFVFLVSALLCIALIQFGLNDVLKRMRQFSRAMTEMRDGHLETKLPETSPIGELQAIARQFNATTLTLKQAREDNKSLSISLINSQEQERRRLGSELHDNLGQIIAGLRARVYLLNIQTQSEMSASGLETLKSVSDELEEAHRVIRNLITELDPMDLQTVNLNEALNQICMKWMQVTYIECELEASCEVSPAITLVAQEVVHIIRIVQESLHNIYKHSNANKVTVSLVNTRDYLDLKIEDNGVSSKELKSGYGLRSMQVRAKELGARLRIQKHSTGVTVHLHKTHQRAHSNELLDC